MSESLTNDQTRVRKKLVADFENLGVVDVEGELLVLQLEHVIVGSGRVHEVVARAGFSDHADKDQQKTIFRCASIS